MPIPPRHVRRHVKSKSYTGYDIYMEARIPRTADVAETLSYFLALLNVLLRA